MPKLKFLVMAISVDETNCGGNRGRTDNNKQPRVSRNAWRLAGGKRWKGWPSGGVKKGRGETPINVKHALLHH